jgi:hypothetical protein
MAKDSLDMIKRISHGHVVNAKQCFPKHYSKFWLSKDTACAKCLSIRCRVANLGDFSPKNANLGIFLAFGEIGDFLGNFESHL